MRVALRLLPLLLLPLLPACSQTESPKAERVRDAPIVPAVPAAGAPAIVKRPPVPPAPPVAAEPAEVQNIAAYLGGLAPDSASTLGPLAQQPAWRGFAADADKSWARYKLTHTAPMRRWASAELDSVYQASPTIFYPFSGPDFLNVFTLFPRAQTYVLVGLEPVGSVPTPAMLRNPALYPAIKASLWSVLNFSFFRTNDMAVDLKSVQLDGALPLIMLFAARTGNQLTAIRSVQLDAAGHVQAGDSTRPGSSKTVPGAEIRFRAADGTEKTIYYFSADISDGGLSARPALLSHVQRLGPLTTYVKSATYLMHKAYFSKIRNLILSQSAYVLQDDSGIAMKYFSKGWQFTHYGTYRRPINLFAKHYQPALTAAYRDSLRPPRPLPFGTGYNWRQTDSNLLLARRKQVPAS